MEDLPLRKKAKFESIQQQSLNSNIINESLYNAPTCSNFPSTTIGNFSNSFVDDIAHLLLVKNFVIVQGPSGSGKTYSAKIISEKCRVCLNILQISNQVDAKSLYGSYTCTEVPGEFVWESSKFAQYIQQECLILLENIDHGGPDLASAILYLIENRFIELPNGIKINMNKNCRILGSIEEYAQQISSIPLILDEYPYKVKLAAPTFDQLNNVLKEKYPKLENIREKLISLFFAVFDVIKQKKVSIDRLLNTKDLFRAMSRLNSSPPAFLIDPHAIFLELIDVWAIHLTTNSLKLEVATLISEALSLAKEEQHLLLNIRHPKFIVDNEKVEIGRIKLERRQMTEINFQTSNFVLTRDATSLLERLAASVIQKPPEPVLLTGETGVGKTSSVQYLANLLRVPLRVVNLSQESESSDLLGGYKPTSPLNILRPLADEYFCLFQTYFDLEKNSKFLANVNKCFNSQRFGDFLKLIFKSSTRICRRLPEARKEWIELARKTSKMIRCFSDENGERWRSRVFFTYMKGVVTQAVEQGQWLLVDEINLASAECLDVLVELLEQSTDFHPNFRLFACMNHATDIGKRQLLNGIRAKFTELLVCETSDVDQLHVLIRGHLPSLPKDLVDGVLNFYLDICSCFPLKFSLRNLSRALTLASELNGSQLNSLLHACHLSFSSQLGMKQRERMCQLLSKSFGLSTIQFSSLNSDKIDDSRFVLIEGFPVPRGSESIINGDDYVFTSSVKVNMRLLASVVSTRKFPILLEGETSAGKTSMVVQLAKMSGNCVYRINNHEHSDIQEYIGTYAPDSDGRLVFAEGLLLKALKFGHWIILDELNLAPSSILEALNRLLDDNRELFVSELNCTIKAHPRFQLFATQNPFGVYSGRKRLSRAFLNRFMVIQCDTIPLSELPQIVQQRCGIAPKQAELAVKVLQELRNRRAISKIFSSSDGLMTLRDLFRWANRLASQKNHDDWRQSMADHGYFVLATRCRTTQDENDVVRVLEQILQRKIDIDLLFGENSPFMPLNVIIPQHIVLTKQFRRTLILCSEAWKCDEPVLLIGDTGCGKTSAVHLFGNLLSINCHERTDASDLLGSIRPVSNSERGPTFRWQDGIVVQAMRSGQRVLIDEISLAADSVLERLNSLLESERTILLTNPASSSTDESCAIEQLVKANNGFQLVATMNPGNDHGKRELSKALRNRFTEIWCQSKYDREDAMEIIRQRLNCCNSSVKLSIEFIDSIARIFIEFTEFFANQLHEIIKFIPSLRDLVGLAEIFMEMLNTTCSQDSFSSNTVVLLYHSIEATFLDALGILPQRMAFNRNSVIEQCQKKFSIIVQQFGFACTNILPQIEQGNFIFNDRGLFIGPFSILNQSSDVHNFPKGYSLNSPSTRQNLLRIARALSSKKPIMLEGSPGSGKSSLVMALAAATGHKLIRLNLSEQTDIYDLFGTDIPITQAGVNYATFIWKDGPVLKAIKEGHWILLDEMNLASQSVLEGLNSCFDFRNNIYISELNRTFDVDARKCRFFACQNPHSQGGDRRALPKSFVNRFISIFIEEMTEKDFIFILTEYSKTIPDGNSYLSEELIAKIVLINKLFQETDSVIKSRCEFNLRDLFRFLEATVMFGGNVDFSFDLVYLSRLSTKDVKQKVINTIYNRVFYPRKWIPSVPLPKIDLNLPTLSIGNVKLNYAVNETSKENVNRLCLLATQMELFEKVAACSQANWLTLLIGPSHCGKRSVIKTLAQLTGKQLYTMRLTSGTDALDLLGSFEQIQFDSSSPNLQPEQNENLSLDEFALPNDRGGLCFKWVESIFLRAFRDGHWLLVEDVNCCNSAVLDCLNSCLESTNGELLLPIDDSQVVHRHPDFRIFFSMNPRNGQISRAMRNRTLEIQFCVDHLSQHEQLWSKNPYDVLSIIFYPCFELQKNLEKSIFSEEKVMFKCFKSILTNNLSFEYLLKCSALLYAKLKSDSNITNFNIILQLFLSLLAKQNNLSLTTSSIPCYFPLLRPSLKNKLSTKLFEYYFNSWLSICKYSIHLNIPTETFVQMALVFPSELILDHDYVTAEPLLDRLNCIFNNIELRMSIKIIYKQMREFISKIRINEGDKLYIIDELLVSTFEKFQSNYSLWSKLNSSITNSTLIGEHYLISLCSSTCICKPFENYDQLNLCIEKWNAVENMLVDKVQNFDESKSVFAPLKQHLFMLLNKIWHLFCSSSTSTSLLERINLVGNERLFLFSRFMSSSSFLIDIDFNEQPQTFFSLLDDTFITRYANSLLWSHINYSNKLLKHIRVCEMFDALNQLERTSELFWDIVFTSKPLKKTKNIHWSECEKHFLDDSDNIQPLKVSVESILAKIKSLTPPKDFLDYIFYIHKHNNYLQIKSQHLEQYFSALRDFFQLTISKSYEMDQVCEIASNNSKFFEAFYESRQATISALDNLEGEFSFWTKNRCVFRIELLGDDVLAYKKNFQKNVVDELFICTAALNELFTPYFLKELHNYQTIPPDSLERFCCLLSNSLQTIQVLKKRLCSLVCSNLPTFLLFPDIFIPYLFALNCLIIYLSEQHKCAKEQCHSNQQRKIVNVFLHSFEKQSYEKINQRILLNQLTILISDDINISPQQKLPILLWHCNKINDINLTKKCHVKFLLWIFKHWEHWHETNAKAKIEQLYFMKKKKINQSGDILEDDDEVVHSDDGLENDNEFNNYLPDFSNSLEKEPKDGMADNEDSFLNSDEIYSALKIIFSSSENIKLPFLNFMCLLSQLPQKLVYCSSLANENFAFHHLLQLNELQQQLKNQFPLGQRQILPYCSPLNVYKECEPAALLNCSEALDHLKKASCRLKDEFPENAQLLQLLSSIDIFNDDQAGLPMMKHAAQLERVLEHAEAWESISDRAHSIRDQMCPLQELLVEWRRREVQCWSELVNHFKRDSAQLAILLSWPLFKNALELKNDGSKLLLMFIEWLQNSTLGDFETRLWTGRLLSHCLSLLEDVTYQNVVERKKLSYRISCVVAHFDQFKVQVMDFYTQLYTPIEKELLNFTTVVRYNDLNLWSVRESTKRARVQLIRILRKFKEMYNESLSSILHDKLPKMPNQALELFPISLPSLKNQYSDSTLSYMINNFDFKFNKRLKNLFVLDELNSIKLLAVDFLQLVMNNVSYQSIDKSDETTKNSDSIDSANEKLHGRALFERQQRFSLLIRTLKRFGLDSRRSHKLDSEILTIETLTQISPDIRNLLVAGDTINLLFRHNVASRNVFMRKFASWRHCLQHTPHLSDQLSPFILENLRGTTEFGLYWIFQALNGLATTSALEVKRLKLASKCFETELENVKYSKNSFCTSLTHKQITDKFIKNCDYIQNIYKITDRMSKILSCCPKEHYNQTYQNLETIQEHLGSLRQSDLQFSQLYSDVDNLLNIVLKLCKLNDKEHEMILRLPTIYETKEIGLNEENIWNKSRWFNYSQNFCSLIEDIKSLLITSEHIKYYFPDDYNSILEFTNKICLLFDDHEEIIQSDQSKIDEASFAELQQILLIRLQNFFIYMEPLLDSDINRLDAVKSLIEYFGQNSFQSSNRLIQTYHSIFLSHSICTLPEEMLNKFFTLSEGISKLYERLLHYLCEFIFQLISLHEHWVAIGCYLLTNGFVNPIPKAGPVFQGDDKKVENMCGFGEGDLTNDAKDVGEELETMEQIEGLKGGTENDSQNDLDQSNENPTEQQKLPEVDTPIDVEDDFDGCIEGLDAQDGEEEKGDDDNGEEEDQNAEWNFGEVDEPEEKQLDPNLWEQDENEINDKEDDNAANNGIETDDIVAAQQHKQQKTNENQNKKGENQEKAEVSQEKVDADENDQFSNEIEEIEEGDNKTDEVNDKNPDDIEEIESGIEETEEGDDVEKGNDDEYLNDDDEEQQNQNEELHDEKNNMENKGELEKEDDENLLDECKNDQLRNDEFEQDAIGDVRGIPNAVRPPGVEMMDDKQNETNCAEADGEDVDKNMDNNNSGNDQHCNDFSTKNSNRSAQQDKNPQEEELNENELDKIQGNNENGGGGSISADEEKQENIFDEVEQEKVSVIGTSTFEQANRTKALFDSSLRRLRMPDLKNELAENASDGKNLNEEKQQEAFSEEIDMDSESNDSIKIIDSFAEKGNCSVYLNFAEKINFDFEKTSNDFTTMDHLCKEFDRLERENSQNEDDIHQMQMKWALISEGVNSLASELTESLRTIIAPTVANKLQGDYRTGKRLNMRRLIAYIASDYRRDQIWMRRTKCAKRNYQVCIAVDNSQSMKYNHFTEITCNSLCLIERALRQLEIGQLAVCSFGSNVQMLSDFSSAEDLSLGLRIFQTFKFDQQRTDISQMLEFSVSLFKNGRECSLQTPEQMLIILSDGRDVLANGVANIKKYLEHLQHDRVAVLFLIMDTAEQSITEVRVADFTDSGCTFRPYMECFPFPFYALVRSTNALPTTIAEAVRQWFEYTNNE